MSMSTGTEDEEAGYDATTLGDCVVAPQFNGGKMFHVFEFDNESGLYSEEFSCDEAAVALKFGTVYYKIDGSNGMILRGNDNKLLLFQRLDTKGRPPSKGCVALPAGPNIDVYDGHSYYYQPITTDVEGKKAKKRNQAMLDAVERHKDRILSLGKSFVSIEWVGAKFNKTPGVPHDVAIAIHSEQVCEEEFDRSFCGVKEFLLGAESPLEGLILEYEGLFWKIRADCFHRKCRFKTDHLAVRAPKYYA